MARELEPRFAKKGEGHIVFIASLAGKVGSPRSSIYNATKFGLRGFAFGLREDLHPYGAGVSIVSPGFVREAGMFHDAGSRQPPGLGTTTPKKVAKAVVKAIRRDRLEITVAPRRQRLITEIGYRHPGIASRVQRSGGARPDRGQARRGPVRQAIGGPISWLAGQDATPHRGTASRVGLSGMTNREWRV